MKKLNWQPSDRPVPKHPYRDSALAYAGMAVLLFVVVFATDGSLVKGVIAGAAVFAASTAYSWWRWHDRLKQQEDKPE